MSQEPKLLFEETLTCPVCKKNTLHARDYLYEVPIAGMLILSNWVCENCGYRFRDVKPYETNKPKLIKYKVENKDDLKTIVYRSPFGKIIIPELELEIEPASASQGYITTVEGILEIVLDQIESYCDDNCMNMINNAMDGKISFTLMIEDESGLSFIKSDKAKIEELVIKYSH
ncbi:ZPR1 zinc finger domain-containing protein [Saccharolobus sp. A20]|uniref:ZPR1 zinc finger domain-containing protein n=1 Tax=Saccharolobus sp. A20 TaxID=1891280 RepID=UPI000845DF36|nr:ZPR1 zinc finger domain-containing protein [Sulfolobus sp. A20]